MCPTGWACRVRGWPFFFFSDTATTEIYTLSLHDALPISVAVALRAPQLAPATVLLAAWGAGAGVALLDRKSTRLNSSHPSISYAVFCLKKKSTNALTPNLIYTPATAPPHAPTLPRPGPRH